jgi:putative sterol carrier protein
MPDRAVPPPDIAPLEFFTRWVPATVDADPSRRERLRSTRATLEFELTGEGGGTYHLAIDRGAVRGAEGPAHHPDLHVRLDVPTWRGLNAGELSAPEALLRRRVHLKGDLALALKLHLILG